MSRREKLWTKLPPKNPMGDPLKSANDLWSRACLYFDWADDSGLIERKIGFSSGKVLSVDCVHDRVYSIYGLLAYIGVTRAEWRSLPKKGDDYAQVVDLIDHIIREQSFSGAAVGLFNASLIAKQLKIDVPDTSNSYDEVEDLTDEYIAEALKAVEAARQKEAADNGSS